MPKGAQKKESDITYDILEELGVLDVYQTGWQKEVNLIAWNNGNPKIDIRDWSPEREHMSRGITLHTKEAVQLMKILEERFVNQ